MKILFGILIAIGLCAVADPIAYLAAKHSYEKNPDADRSAQYDILEMMFGRKKWAMPLSFAIGAVCFAASIWVKIAFISV